MLKTAIIGGGAAGFFLGINLKEMMPEMCVTIFERSQHVLAKVAVSGGGRCNCTNSFEDIHDLKTVYPRGHRLMKRLFKGFNHRDAYEWFEQHGVRLTTQADHCVFPASQDAQTIIDCFLHYSRHYGIDIRVGVKVSSLDELADFDFIVVTTGGSPRLEGLQWLTRNGHEAVQPVPSLFTFNIEDPALRTLMGAVAENAVTFIPGTNYRASGPLLITHWGMSGPAILRLSSYAARHLYENDYRQPLCVNWTGCKDAEVLEALYQIVIQHPQKQLTGIRPFDLPQRLWSHLLEKSMADRKQRRWVDLSKKDINRLCNTLCNDTYQIAGRAPFKDEFVTCGGISLAAVNPSTLESRVRPRLFFAGEVLDVDGITGGFNFQAAWTTAYTVAQAIRKQVISC